MSDTYGKLFESMYEGSLYGNFEGIVVLQALVILADKDGVVDMTPQALAGRTSYPLEIINKGLEELSKPDPLSRSSDEDGRRIVLLNQDRSWGWQIVNYMHYRDKGGSLEKRREQDAERQRRRREEMSRDSHVTGSQCHVMSAHTDTDTDTDTDTTVKKTYTAEFQSFWQKYPSNRRGHKGRAYEKWKKIDKTLHSTVTEYVRARAAEDPDWKRENFRYVPHAERFLAGERWEDDWQPAKQWSERTQANIDRLMGLELS